MYLVLFILLYYFFKNLMCLLNGTKHCLILFTVCKIHTSFSWSKVDKHCLSLCIFSRLVHSGPGKSSSGQESDLTFGLRLGTKHGVETHLFRVDTPKELSTWSHLLVEGCHTAAELIQEVTTGTFILL